MRARKSPPPDSSAAATAAAGKDLKPFGGGGGSGGARFLFFGIYFSAPIPGFSGGILCGVEVAPPVPAHSGRGVAPQAPGQFSRPEGRARSLGVSVQSTVISLAE